MNTVKVRYKYENSLSDDDLVCDLTEFMDKYLVNESPEFMCTYLYNDLSLFSNENLLQIAFRYPGATRGSILLKRKSTVRFEIVGFGFNSDVCFGAGLGCYKKELSTAIDSWVGTMLDFSDVELKNNYAEITY